METIEFGDGHRLSYVASKPNASVIFLHGIMGNKKNLHGFVQKFLINFSHLSAITFDLRNHGESSKHWEPYTVRAAAVDIVHACEKLTLPVSAIIGHSFGGKVALVAATMMPSLEQLWLLDCPPGVIVEDAVGKEHRQLNTMEVIETLERLSWPVPTRRELVSLLLAHGVSNNIALWMTTNLIGDGGGLRLSFDPSEMSRMLKDFIHLDGWPLILELGLKCTIHLVAAERGQRVSDIDEDKLAKITDHRGYFHRLKDSGHFVHADNPQGLLKIMSPFFAKA